MLCSCVVILFFYFLYASFFNNWYQNFWFGPGIGVGIRNMVCDYSLIFRIIKKCGIMKVLQTQVLP